jgi:ELWxxDGT repeat protein
MRLRQIAEALLSMALAAGPLRAAEVPQLLADINSTASQLQSFANLATGFAAAGERLLFSTFGNNSLTDDEGILWRTDGTASGAQVLSSSLCPFPCQGIFPLGTWHGLVLLQVTLGKDSPETAQLWRSDGTAAGTFPLTGLLDNTDQFGPQRLQIALAPDIFYFNGCRQPERCRLWRSDGTRSGTFPLPSSPANPRTFAFWAGRLYFLGDTAKGAGLWRTDGTTKGTAQLASVDELDGFSGRIVATPSHLFFTAGDTSEDLGVTDGTPDGTRRVADFPPTPCFPGNGGCTEGEVSSLFAFGDSAFFITHRPNHGTEIWHSDGTPDGTGPQVELLPAAQYIADKRHVGSHWLLAVETGPDLTLWTANDDFGHAEPLSGCDAGACPGVVRLLSQTGNDSLLFAGTDDAHGTELWITDGTGGGTRRLSDICPGSCSGLMDKFADSGELGSAAGLTYFRALPSAEASPFSASDELWVTDGSAAGTHRVAGHVSDLGVLGGLAFFGAFGETEDSASELWTTNGTAAGTRRVSTLQRVASGSEPSILNLRSRGVFVLAWNGTTQELWRSDGTPAGTHPVPGGELDASRRGAFNLTAVDTLEFFIVLRQTADPNVSDTELWRTDGTGSGTRGVASFGEHAFLDLLTPWSGRLLFLVHDSSCAFWTSDGTSEGTRRILLATSVGRRCPTAVASLDPARFLFIARVEGPGGPVPQVFLWDGTTDGTRQISAIRGTRETVDLDSPVVAGGVAFFRIASPLFGDVELWRSDGTPAGTFRIFQHLREVSDLFTSGDSLYFNATQYPGGLRRLYRAALPGPGLPVALAQTTPVDGPVFVTDPLQYTPARGKLFFIGWDAQAGSDLWVTDGTPAGTRRVKRPGSRSSSPDGLVAAGNRIFFSGDDGEHGRELWVSDGTPRGTHMVWDLNPGGFGSNPTSLTVSGGNLFFSADDGQTGVEPWALKVEP